MNSFSKVFKNIISDIKVNGKVSKPRDLEVSELMYAGYAIDPTLSIANFNSREFNWKYFAGELVWYLNKDTNVDYINKFSGFWKGITNPGTNEINSNYGSLLFGEQLQWVTDSLKKDKNTRQAIAFLNQPKYQFEGNKDFVCTMYLNFSIREDKLDMKVQMRSNDIFYGLTFDAPFFALVHQHVYLWLKSTYPELSLGTYHHFADNIHFYERHYDLAEKIVHEPLHENQYKMELTEPLFNINKGNMIITDHAMRMIDIINRGVVEGKERDYYNNVLSKYLNIKKN
ncbi:thymidylate synthase [bacterium]|nr:thymidylate synthase [bacterium]